MNITMALRRNDAAARSPMVVQDADGTGSSSGSFRVALPISFWRGSAVTAARAGCLVANRRGLLGTVEQAQGGGVDRVVPGVTPGLQQGRQTFRCAGCASITNSRWVFRRSGVPGGPAPWRRGRR